MQATAEIQVIRICSLDGPGYLFVINGRHLTCESFFLCSTDGRRIQAMLLYPLHGHQMTLRASIRNAEQVPQHGRLEGQFVIGKMTRQPAVFPGTCQLGLGPLPAEIRKSRLKDERRNGPVLCGRVLPTTLLRVTRQHAQLRGIGYRPFRIPAVEASYHGRIAPGAQHVQTAAIHQITYRRHPGQLIPEFLGIGSLLLR